VQAADNRSASDDLVIAFAASKSRPVLTLNRRDFIRIHRASCDHAFAHALF
jgi:hypothetical protein